MRTRVRRLEEDNEILRKASIFFAGGTRPALVLPYALPRWTSGREAVIGLGIILVWLGVHVAEPTTVD